ncbi:hypothetical protein BHD05_04010 [Marisediminicola antarctica]|uniref:Uncharacterized protein n=1 Tax=Marisediminicola antarctica TaxID=674079 RepID=A0A7L5AG34_9MICO|nr:hypothetical protein BHD05_04010 [Marisediminicola antarctica]
MPVPVPVPVPVPAASAELALVQPATVAERRDWLAANHADARGAWVAIGKKGNTVTALDYDGPSGRPCASAGSTAWPDRSTRAASCSE